MISVVKSLLILSFVFPSILLSIDTSPDSFFKDGNVKNRIIYDNNRPIKKIDYYETGEMKSIVNLDSEGKNNGIEKIYDKNKNLISEIKYRHSFTPSKKVQYYRTGELRSIVNFDSDGKNNGIEKIYDKNKNLISEIEYIHSFTPSKKVLYYKTGEKKIKIYYINGKKSKVETYFISGELKSLTPYINDKVNGQEYIYYKSGKVRYQLDINDNILVRGLIYDSRGNKPKIMSYLDFITLQLVTKE